VFTDVAGVAAGGGVLNPPSPVCAPVGSASESGPSACANAVAGVAAAVVADAALADTVLADAAPGAMVEVLSEFGSEAPVCVLETPAAAGAGAPLPAPLTLLPALLPVPLPLLRPVLLPPTAPLAVGDVEADVATAAATGEVGGGEELPGAGNCPPLDPPSWALFAVGLRAGGLEDASFSAAAKSLPLVLSPAASAEAAPPACSAALALVVRLTSAASLLIGSREITGIAFIPSEIASDVPSAALPPTIAT
jgi:hypothetical protein